MALPVGTQLLDGDDINRATATGPPLVLAPLTGTTVSLLFAQRVIYVNPAGTIAALTIRLPPMQNAGGVVTIGFGQIVTALTVQDAFGNAVQSTAGAVGAAVEYRYMGSGNWVRWR